MEARVAKLESDVKLLDSKFEAVKNRAYDIIREKFMDKSNIDPRHDGIKIFPYY